MRMVTTGDNRHPGVDRLGLIYDVQSVAGMSSHCQSFIVDWRTFNLVPVTSEGKEYVVLLFFPLLLPPSFLP
jgi:hypothetical protein